MKGWTIKSAHYLTQIVNKKMKGCSDFLSHERFIGTFFLLMYTSSASQSKNAVSRNIKQSRYIHLMSNFSSISFHIERLYVHMFDIVDTPFSYGRGLIVCSSLQEFSKTKESILHMIWNVDTAFLLCGAEFWMITSLLQNRM